MERVMVRGIRGATSVEENTPEAIRSATIELLEKIVEVNDLDIEDIASAFFTVTNDVNADFPAFAARELGWTYVPLLCATEIEVAGSLPGIIRVLLHTNTIKSQKEIKHVYLNDAVKLRKDLVNIHS